MTPAALSAERASAAGRGPRLAALLACGVVLAALLSLFRGFVLDDAYITYRYARNLAISGTLAWNPGEDPVEGYTSFLWVLVNAAGIRAGLDPVAVSKALGSACALGILALLGVYSRRAPWSLLLILGAGVALSPSFALVSMQGMETSAAALLVLLAAGLAIPAMTNRDGVPWALMGAVLAAFLARPDTAVFSGVLLASMAIAHALGGRRAALARLLAGGAALAAALGAYMGWRLSYFGWFFPNTYYIKAIGPGDAGGPSGPAYAWGFTAGVAGPYFAMIAFAIFRRASRPALARTGPVLAGVAAFLVYLASIVPIQGMAWRFAFPVLPALLLVAMEALTPIWPKRIKERAAWVIPLLALLVWWPARDAPAAFRIAEGKSQRDRVLAGKSLAGLGGTMLTSEAGALPYYSGWRAVDILGLNSERIAHEGLGEELLAELNPDLVVTRYDRRKGLRMREASAPVLLDFLATRGYVAIAAVAKNDDDRHVYFARADSPIYAEVTRRLSALPGVRHVPLEDALVDPRIPLHQEKPAAVPP